MVLNADDDSWETSPVDHNFRPTYLMFKTTANHERQHTSLNINSLTILLLNMNHFYFKVQKYTIIPINLCYKPVFFCLNFINHINIFSYK